MPSDHYDLIVIGSGPGGASLAHRLAPTGKRILILERGVYLPRSERNWSAQDVFVDDLYRARETWTNAKGDSFNPALHYYVGGKSKLYGAALFRLRERDFGEVVHAGGISPAWPLGMTCSSHITPRPNSCSTSTASAARTPASPGQAVFILTHLSPTPPVAESDPSTSSVTVTRKPSRRTSWWWHAARFLPRYFCCYLASICTRMAGQWIRPTWS